MKNGKRKGDKYPVFRFRMPYRITLQVQEGGDPLFYYLCADAFCPVPCSFQSDFLMAFPHYAKKESGRPHKTIKNLENNQFR